MQNPGLRLFVVFSALFFVGSLEARQESLSCRLVSKTIESIDTETPVDGLFLTAAHSAGVCIFSDGRIADKQFVFSQSRKEDFSAGTYAGFSVYTFENGDSIVVRFDGGWDGNKGNKGIYDVVSGTGAYANATGSGSITGVDSPWKATSWFDIVLDVEM